MRLLVLFCLCLLSVSAAAQEFTKADSLRGMLSPLRAAFDVHFYELDVEINPELRTIAGFNSIHFEAISDLETLQLDLFQVFTIDSIVYQKRKLEFSRAENTVFVRFKEQIKKGSKAAVQVFYHGTPIAAKSAPWDGGFVWSKDANGKHHIGVACEGFGASSWWPNKDHLSDEPDSMLMHYTGPNGLMCVGNGQLMNRKIDRELSRWTWKVVNPINNYNVTLNIGDFAHFQSHYTSGSDSLALNYYVLRDNLQKAKEHFKQVQPMMAIYEEAFGRYPFWEDGYALIETPYAGMEHQSAIAYGNKYMKGYWGRFPSDMDFDYIIIHETGHEWWGNSVSMNDMADMWIHESFCTYAESVFVEGKYGYAKMLDYMRYQKYFIDNKSPILGVYGMNAEGNSNDMYYKGAWMLHTLRSVINDDAVFKPLLKAIAMEFRHQNIDGEELIQFVNRTLGKNMSPFFAQYLGQAKLPVLEYQVKGKKVRMRWNAATPNFAMPMEIVAPNGTNLRVEVGQNEWVTVEMEEKAPKTIAFREDKFLFEAVKVGKVKGPSPKF
jgi:aminopeptidase N